MTIAILHKSALNGRQIQNHLISKSLRLENILEMALKVHSILLSPIIRTMQLAKLVLRPNWVMKLTGLSGCAKSSRVCTCVEKLGITCFHSR